MQNRFKFIHRRKLRLTGGSAGEGQNKKNKKIQMAKKSRSIQRESKTSGMKVLSIKHTKNGRVGNHQREKDKDRKSEAA